MELLRHLITDFEELLGVRREPGKPEVGNDELDSPTSGGKVPGNVVTLFRWVNKIHKSNISDLLILHEY